jgi:hypothetical protein
VRLNGKAAYGSTKKALAALAAKAASPVENIPDSQEAPAPKETPAGIKKPATNAKKTFLITKPAGIKKTTTKQISKIKNPSSPKPSPYSTSSMLSTEYINDHLPERTDRDLKYELDVNPRTGATPGWSHHFSGSKLNDIKGAWDA